ncbi:MAG: hypothetical protein QS721_10920 [Candidatus Endonucleobacter sp. (ex Gigantidas childressi)]|nr:hypothetical protein [Candidatus Endonucleobacter sp. (ex Gigantidas childressi)]
MARLKKGPSEGKLLPFSPARDEVMTITYQQLDYEQRCQISALKKSGCNQR